MTRNIEKEISEDKYIIEKRSKNDVDELYLLQECNNRCAICHKKVLSSYRKSKLTKLYQIAHIYPSSPTEAQYLELFGLERLGDNNQDINNKIVLCLDCHRSYDNKTTKNEYIELVKIKKGFLKKTEIDGIIEDCKIENELAEIIDKLINTNSNKIEELNYNPVEIKNKFTKEDALLKEKIVFNVTKYFPFIKDMFIEMENKNNFDFEVLSCEIRLAYKYLYAKEQDKNVIFEMMKKMFIDKTGRNDSTAMDIIVSFFIQDCEIFDEISK